jgi:DNA-binding protein H-NS
MGGAAHAESLINMTNRRLYALAEARRLVLEHQIDYDELIALEVPRGSSTWERQRRIATDQCRQLIAFWDIRPSDLRGQAVDAPKARPPKYRHPVEGHTWDGEGLQPEWLRQALLKDGYTVRELRIDSEPTVS